MSSNNPFRNASVESEASQYQSDKDFQEWVSSNTIYHPSGSRPKNSSMLSLTESIEEEPHRMASPSVSLPREPYSMTPPPRPASNNPFLDDMSPQSGSESPEEDYSPPQPTNGNGGGAGSAYPTAQEEKNRLRRRYIEQPSISDPVVDDLPPSYDEVAAVSKKPAAPYPREKSSSRYASSSTRSSDRRESSERSAHRRHRDGSERTHHSSSRRHREAGTHGSDRRKSSKDKKSSSSSKPLAKNVDTIDKLDVTGLFGGAFHHDGPFDACTPHRNRNTKVAPVMAFPADGPNSSIAGAANSKSPMKEVFGQEATDDDDAYLYGNKIYSRGNNSSTNTIGAIKPNMNGVTQFDVKAKNLVHGPTTVGLGSTTFLDGAPATGAANSNNRLHPQHLSSSQMKKVPSQKSGNGDYAASGDVYRREPLKLAKTHSGHLENDEDSPDEDVYLSTRFDPSAKKSSTSGNKFMRRVKSLKVGRKS